METNEWTMHNLHLKRVQEEGPYERILVGNRRIRLLAPSRKTGTVPTAVKEYPVPMTSERKKRDELLLDGTKFK